MDFEKVLPLIIKEFEQKNIRYALIGGFALGALGIMRATMDLDFLVDAQDLNKIEEVMRRFDYTCIFKTENVSQYVSDLKIFGEIDFLHAFRNISVSMLKRAKKATIFENKYTINVLCSEDIIGLKLQALVNDKSRENREYADIEMLMEYYGEDLNWDLIEEYYALFDKGKEFKRIRDLYKNAQ
ncbi:MAG: nucleotidyl transferase AbiEii/AbiGii toxin family protein [bacterium]